MINRQEGNILLSRFLRYIQKNRWYILVFYGLLLMVWMPWMQQVLPRIDTEILINDPFSTNGWLTIGRQGGILSRYLLGMYRFNPLFAIIGGYLLICISGIVFAYLLRQAAGRDSVSCIAFGLICFTCPIMAEQFYFDMQILMVGLAYIVCGVNVGLSYYGILRRKWLCILLAILGMIWTFSTYQIFTVLYVVLAVTCFILLYWRCTVGGQCEQMQYWRIIGILMGMFAIAFIANTIISNSFFMSSNYLQGQIYWGSVPWKQNLEYIVSHIKNAITGDGIYFTPLYGILALATICSVLIQVCRLRPSMGWLVFLAALGLQLMPFLLTVYLGGTPAIRAQLAYPMVLACNVVILFCVLPQHKYFKWVTAVIAIVLCWTQTMNTMTLIYTDQVRAQEDMHLAGAIEQRIIQISDIEKPIAFVGAYGNRMTNASVRGDIIGMSIFHCNDDAAPYYVHSTNRICGLSQTFSIPFKPASEEEILQARWIALDMPSWPAEGSVVDAGDFTVVKLSEDNWKEEVLDPCVYEVSSDQAAAFSQDNGFRFYVDRIGIEDGVLKTSGWAFLDNVDSRKVEPALFFYDAEDDRYIRIMTVAKERGDLELVFESKLYRYAGFYGAAPVADLGKNLGAYTLCIGLKYNQQWYMVQTNTNIPYE